jgi:hypothetical protein
MVIYLRQKMSFVVDMDIFGTKNFFAAPPGGL